MPENSPATQSEPAARAWLRLPRWLVALALGLVALLPRCLGLADFFTVDESFHWVWRIMHFVDALEDHRWAATNLTGHPGVMTLWLGAAGRWLAFQVGLTGPELAKGGAAYLALLRLPLALVNSLAVGAGYLLLRRLLRAPTALLAALLWATSPFLIAHSRLLHLDALVTTFLTLSGLLLLAAYAPVPTDTPDMPDTPAWQRWLLLLASGVCMGMALLTKAPSLVMLPLAGGLLLLLAPEPRPLPRIGATAARYALWLACAVLVFWAAWPAMWVAPRAAFGHVLAEVTGNGAQPHESGNYFMGHPTADPGALFYLAVVLWRTTPQTLIGLALLPLALRRGTSGVPGATERRTLLALLGFVLVFGLAMSLLPKKFDRYLLPAWPALEILAAAGLVAACESRAVATRLSRLSAIGYRLSAIAGIVIIAAPLLWYHPYHLAYFNPLLGGGASGQRVLLVGWGEGMEQVGAWLRTRPDLQRSPVISWDPRTLEPFVPVRVIDINPDTVQQPASYAVLYVRGVQRNTEPDAYALIRQTPPLYTLRAYGINYAAVYQPIRPYATPLHARFGGGLRLRGYTAERNGSQFTITPSWSVEAPMEGGAFCFVHVLAADGRRVAQIDAPIDEGLFAQWSAGQQFGSPLPLALPEHAPRGPYRVVIGVYRPASGARLPLSEATPLPDAIDGPHVLPLTTITHAP